MKRHEGGIESYPADYLECRGDNHDWQWLTDANIVKNTRGRIIEWRRIRKCKRCGVKVIKTYDANNGRVIGSSYDYSEAEGYLARKNSEIDAGRARVERLRRMGFNIGGS